MWSRHYSPKFWRLEITGHIKTRHTTRNNGGQISPEYNGILHASQFAEERTKEKATVQRCSGKTWLHKH